MARRFQVPETQVRQIVFFGPGRVMTECQMVKSATKSVILAKRSLFVIGDSLTTSRHKDGDDDNVVDAGESGCVVIFIGHPL